MWPFKKKEIKETKRYPYRGKSDMSNYSAWDSMSIIEQFALIILPCMMVFLIYMMCDMISTGLQWWVRLPIAIGITSLLLLVISVFATWMTERDYQ